MVAVFIESNLSCYTKFSSEASATETNCSKIPPLTFKLVCERSKTSVSY